MAITMDDVKRLRCPIPNCRGSLSFEGDAPNGRLESGVLKCNSGKHNYGVRGGIPLLVNEGDVSGMDALLRPIYDLIAPVHDAGVQYMLPLLQFPDPHATRLNYIEKLEINRLREDVKGEMPRFLEVGIGAAANVRLLDTVLPMSGDVEIWGVDLSSGMIEQARRWMVERRDRIVRLTLADAHALPFPDACFDRVFSVGSMNGYRNARLALAEMARVAKPGTPIVVVDEELDPKREHLLLHRVLFRALTAYDANPHAPLEAVPDGAIDVEVTPVSRFYYCLRFWMPAAHAAGSAPLAKSA